MRPITFILLGRGIEIAFYEWTVHLSYVLKLKDGKGIPVSVIVDCTVNPADYYDNILNQHVEHFIASKNIAREDIDGDNAIVYDFSILRKRFLPKLTIIDIE